MECADGHNQRYYLGSTELFLLSLCLVQVSEIIGHLDKTETLCLFEVSVELNRVLKFLV